jgi:hypothetical protein
MFRIVVIMFFVEGSGMAMMVSGLWVEMADGRGVSGARFTNQRRKILGNGEF